MSAGVYDEASKYYKGRVPYSPKMAARLAAGLRFNDSTRILDLACGDGSLSRVIVPHVGHITGLDISAGMLSVAFHDPKIRYIQWDFNRQPIYSEDRRFQHVVVGRALHWLSLERLSDTFSQSVEDGGCLVVCSSSFEPTDWYAKFRQLIQNYGRLDREQARKSSEALPSIGFRSQGTITERFQVKLSLDLLLLHALSLQPVTAAIEANIADFKTRLAALFLPAMKEGAAMATCRTTARVWSR